LSLRYAQSKWIQAVEIRRDSDVYMCDLLVVDGYWAEARVSENGELIGSHRSHNGWEAIAWPKNNGRSSRKTTIEWGGVRCRRLVGLDLLIGDADEHTHLLVDGPGLCRCVVSQYSNAVALGLA
jgi:hypothetical protein